MPSDTTFSVILIEWRCQECSVKLETLIDFNLSFRDKENLLFTNGGLNILRHRACFKSLLASIKKLKIMEVSFVSSVSLETLQVPSNLLLNLTILQLVSILLDTTSKATILERPSSITQSLNVFIMLSVWLKKMPSTRRS